MPKEDLANLLLEGKQLMEKGENKKAIKKFDELIKTDPANADGYFGKAEASLGIPKASLVDVAQLYRMAIKYDPKNAYYYSVYGDFCLSNGLLPQAEENYLKAVEYDSEGAVFHYLDLAVGYFKNGNLFLERQLNISHDDIIKKALGFIFKAYDLDLKTGIKHLTTLSQTTFTGSELEELLKTEEYKNELTKLESNKNVEEYRSQISTEPDNLYNYIIYGQFCFENGFIYIGKEQYFHVIELDPFITNQSLYYNELAGYSYNCGIKHYKDSKSSEFIEKVTLPSLKYSLKALGIKPEIVLKIFEK